MNSTQVAPLHRLWQRIVEPQSADTKVTSRQWHEEVYHLSLKGRALEEALGFLYTSAPTCDSFIAWLHETQPPVVNMDDAPPLLSQQDMDFWDENGYIVIKKAITPQQCTDTAAAIWNYLSAAPTQPESWYRKHEGSNGLMLKFFQHPALDANRRSSKIASAYRQLYGDTEIFQIIDKVSFNPPEQGNYKFKGSPLHWDVSLQPPVPYALQGILYLGDVGENDGAFYCVPGFHRQLAEWLQSLPPGTDPRQAAQAELNPVPVCGKAGDLVIWHQALPHCATPNKGATPRLAQYIAYKPVACHASDIWI